MKRLGFEVDIAELNHRLITTTQLRLEGLTSRQVRYRVATGVLHPVIGGVYSLDPFTDEFVTRVRALCLRYPKGFLSGAAAASFWGMRKGMPNLYEFTVPKECRPTGADFVQFRFSSSIDNLDVVDGADGFRVSSPARAAFEAAHRLDEFGVRSMIEHGLQKRLVTPAGLEEVGKRLCAPGRGGTRLFRQIVAMARDIAPVQSEEELILLDALRAAGLHDAIPQHEVRLAGGSSIHLDVGVPSARAGMEVDGPTHDDPIAVHRDKTRDMQAAVQGWQIVRATTDDVRRRLRIVTASFVAVCRQRVAAVAPPRALS